MTAETYKSSLDYGIQGNITKISRALFAVTMAAGAMVGVAPAAAAGLNGCPQAKSYEQTLNPDELNALTGNAGGELVEKERERLANGVSGAGIMSGSEISVGAGVNGGVTDVPYSVLNGAIQSVLLNQGYRVVDAIKLPVDSGAAGVLKVTQDAVDCRVVQV